MIDGEETTTETTTHDIPEADVQVTPNQGAIGSEIRITGEGFRTFEGVSGIELGTKNVLGGRVFYTDRDGKLDIEALPGPRNRPRHLRAGRRRGRGRGTDDGQRQLHRN